MPGDEKWPAEPQYTAERPLPKDVGEEKVDDGSRYLLTVGVDPRAFRQLWVVGQAGQENGWRKV